MEIKFSFFFTFISLLKFWNVLSMVQNLVLKSLEFKYLKTHFLRTWGTEFQSYVFYNLKYVQVYTQSQCVLF